VNERALRFQFNGRQRQNPKVPDKLIHNISTAVSAHDESISQDGNTPGTIGLDGEVVLVHLDAEEASFAPELEIKRTNKIPSCCDQPSIRFRSRHPNQPQRFRD